MLEIRAIGGYGEYGRNCTAIRVDDEVVLLDMGIHLENYINYTEDEDKDISSFELMRVNALPNISILGDWRRSVVAIVPTHAHLDHVGGIPYLGNEFRCDIISTPFTNSVIKRLLEEKSKYFENRLRVAELNENYKVSEGISVEFVNMTHSTPDSAMVVVHTRYGAVVYANDFKLDPTPTLGEAPNLSRLKEISEKEGVKALILESLYADTPGKTPSETEAKEMLEKLLFELDSDNKSIIVSTFSSHISRLKTIVEIGKKMGRKIIFLGRSLSKYVDAAEECGIVDFSKDVEMRRYGREIKRRMKTLNGEKEKYLIVCTGHQGERRAVLSKMAHEDLDFRFDDDDIVVFSCRVIPSELNEENREVLEEELRKKGVEIHRDVHASGHGSRDDLKELIEIIRPDFVVPAHGGLEKEEELAQAAEELGYRLDKNVFIMKNGDSIEID